MKNVTKIIFVLLVCSSANLSAAGRLTENFITYHGTSDASAAVAISDDMFIVADDENNVLRIYKTLMSGLPIFSYDLTDFLDVDQEYPEADIEGATKIGNRIYWITSHGRNEDGKMRPSRYRFFATDIEVQDDKVSIQPVGIPCKTLIQNLLKSDALRNLGLDKATRLDEAKLTKKERENLAPKKQGLNIEALCATADETVLYICFRNPRPNKKALVVPLYNAYAIIKQSALPVLGKPILWDLNSLGIKSMEYSAFHKAYFIIAGPHNEGRKSVLYRWSGRIDEQPKLVRNLGNNRDFTPEALICFPNSEKLLVLSDDGSLPVKIDNFSECMQGRLNDDGTCPNKFLTDPNNKTFRAIWLIP